MSVHKPKKPNPRRAAGQRVPKSDEQRTREKNLRRLEAEIRQANYVPKPPHISAMAIGLMTGDDRSPYSGMVRGLAGIPLEDSEENKQTSEAAPEEKPEEHPEEHPDQKSE